MNVTDNPTIYIILLHWKDYDNTKSCLDSFKNLTYPYFKVIVVDNFSNDGSIEKLQEEFTDAIYVFNQSNLGFSCGCNAGLHRAYDLGAEYFLLLNNDIVVEPGFLEPAILELMENPIAGAITGKIMYKEPKNVFWQAGGYIDPLRVQGIPRGKGEVDNGQYDTICETGWASGAMSLFSRSTIDKVGFLPEEYFFGQEEWDYSTAILNAGLKIIYVPKFKAYHEAGGSYQPGHPVLNIYGGYLNKMIYAEKYMSEWQFNLWRIAFWLYLKISWPKQARKGCKNEEDYKICLRAAFMAFDDHKTIKKVTLSDLQNATNRLGFSPKWGSTWQSKLDG
jgi:GT2 family glycosyltransferase